MQNGKINGPVVITDHQHFAGQIVGDAHVASGGSFVLYGQLTGDLHIEPGGRASVHGMVCGTIFNNGGLLTLLGMAGDIVSDGSAHSTIDPVAVITHRR
ncbi:hypothetical protein ACIKTA_00375 [Hansschlegelia beijingensis]